MAAAKKLGSGRHISAIKRQRQTAKRTVRNREAKSRFRTEVKKLKTNPSIDTLKKTISTIDRTASKGVIPRRRASRMVSRLTRAVNATR